MISLVITVIKRTLELVRSNENDESDINSVIAQIESVKEKEATVADVDKQYNEEGCCYKTGIITFVSSSYVVIDDIYMCDLVNVSVDNIKVGDKVSYLAYWKDQNEEQKVCKIMTLIDQSWDNTDTEIEDNVRKQMLKRNVIGKVTKREGRKVFVEPNNITFDLNKVRSEFIPIVGDWVKLESLVELNEKATNLSGEVLEVNSIQPLRSKLKVGNISSYDLITETGTIDKSIVFNKLACESGYIPCINDRVITDSIESEQDIYSWRSLTVVPLVQVSEKKPLLSTLAASGLSETSLNNLIKDKYGVVIPTDLSFNLNILEEKELVVTVKNTSTTSHVLHKGTFMSKQSQLTLVWPTVDSVFTLKPLEAISFKFKCKAKFVGTSEELFVFNFKDFKIGRIFRITVNAKSVSVKNNERRHFKRNSFQRDQWDQNMYIPGIRPCKPPSFIKVRNGVFRVPQYMWDVVLKFLNENKSHIECEISIGEKIPSLLNSLSFETYKDRFHTLLYLEEIAQALSMRQYDMENVVMRRCGEYLAMEVPGLAEKRPSLLIGDKAIISFKWDAFKGEMKYEGFIHKITSTEVFLKFNQKVHEEYSNNECQVTFKCSQTALQRSHNAVNVALTRLGPEFLFPTRVIQKEPQIYLEEVEASDKPLSRPKHERKESVSSVCSTASLTSTSDSDNVVKSPPRVSVIERLFKAKPIEPFMEMQKKSAFVKKKNQTDSTNLNGNHRNTEGNFFLNANVSKNDVEIHSDHSELEPYISQVKKRKLIWCNKNLNYYQKEAIRNILRGLARPLPYVIFGPPGTGKTVTLCETILQILITMPESRLLVATPSNSSANLISERLLDSGILKPGDFVRLIAHHCLNDDSIPPRLLPYCATADLAAEGTTRRTNEQSENGTRINCTISTLAHHRIIIGTCIAVGILHNMGFPCGHFSHVLIDEAGQATEPEILIPLNFTHSDYGQVVLVGDPLQLGPVIQSTLARQFGFGESFLARLLHQFPYQQDSESFETSYDPRLVTKLVMNYRSLPEILELSNSLFYNSKLQPQISSKRSEEAELLRSLANELPERKGSPPAIVFHGVIGENLRDTDSPSWYNPEEATQVYLYLMKLYKHGVNAEDIGIITPYQKQVIQIRELLSELDVAVPKVSSVEGFQGQERKVIILSTVRSSSNLVNEDIKHALGFVASPRRLNVAITRARALLIILGNPQLLAQDPYWRSVLIYCINHGGYTGCSFLPSYTEQVEINAEDM